MKLRKKIILDDEELILDDLEDLDDEETIHIAS